MNKQRNILHGLLFCLLAALPAGCSIISPPEPLQIVVLDEYRPAAPICREALPVQILVPQPYPSAGLNTDRIGILIDGREVNYLAGYKWDVTNAQIIQRALVDTLNDSGCFRGAGTGGMALRADYRLEADIKLMHFVYAEGRQQPTAEVNLLLRLVDIESGLMIGQHNALGRDRTASGNIFQSMQSAAHSALQSSLDWTLESLRAYRAGK